ncbi:MAG: tetratricopeptide repeat protein [Planctomycetes bacterium]|nr:tetratricopeptide repeat protein [Planctomycetota bacterium]
MSESDRWKRAQEHCRHRRPAEAVALCGEILREDPAHRAALEMLAELAHQVGENDRSARLDPGLHAAWYALGCVRQAQKNDAAAMEAFERAVAIDPRHAASQHNLGQTLFRLGLVDEAIERFRLSLARVCLVWAE